MKNTDTLARLAATLNERKDAEQGSSYVASLYAKGIDAISKKIIEEATETVLAAKEGDVVHVVAEVADLWFHSMVLLAHFGVGPADVLAELQRREGVSGIEEKNARQSSE